MEDIVIIPTAELEKLESDYSELRELAKHLAKFAEPSGISGDIAAIRAGLSIDGLARKGKVFADNSKKDETDLGLAISLYENLELTPAQAADMNFWLSLTILHFSDYVWARWSSSEGITVERVDGRSKNYRQALYRLWSAVHRTRDPTDEDDPYKLTTALFTHSSSEELIVNTTEARLAFRLRLVTERFITHCSNENTGFIRRTAVLLSQAAANHDIECMDGDELDSLFRSISPKSP